MRRHVIRAFRRMPVMFASLWNQALEKVPQIQRHIWVCILLND
jgi:hypothetical protein